MTEAARDGTAGQADAFPMVAIGGSAGSLEALKEFLAALPEDPGMAFVITTHHPPARRSLLPQILAEGTALAVSQAEDGVALEPDHVYVAPSDSDWRLEGRRLVRQPRENAREQGAPDRPYGPPHPVDALFRSLAAELGSRAIGIVLSGTGTDGTVGVRAIKSQAGMVMVQQPESAGFQGMPDSAIATNLVDYVLRPGDMPAALLAYAQAESQRSGREGGAHPDIPENILAGILQAVTERTGHDFSGYKQSTLLRRLERRMHVNGVSDAGEYLTFLRANPAETDLLFKEAIISVTNFFRDPDAWESLATGVLRDQLALAAAEGRGFRAWVVGCATGEEPYTLAILVCEALEAMGTTLPVQIFATDVDPEAVETARVGRYPAGIADDLTPERLRRFFIPEEDTYRVTKPLRNMVVFAEHNVLQDPPFTRMDLLTCRNLLIYLERELQRQVLPVFQYALRPAGVLFLGSSESVEDMDEAFSDVDKRWRIYRAEEGGQPPATRLMPSSGRGLTMFRRSPESPRGGEEGGFTHSVERLLASEFAPPAVLVNDRGEALFFHGHTGRFLEPASGPAQNRLTDMARDGLRAPLVQALRKVNGPDAEPARRRVWVRTDGEQEEVEVEVRPVHTPRTLRGLRLVSFLTLGSSWPGQEEATGDVPEPRPGRELQLERELDAARQDKQVTVEELQSSNEELQSMNEELQSSNEELEVSKEEVESLNEELRSVNAELEARVSDLAQANDDMKNLLDSTEIALLFLDADMHVTRFTEQASKLISLRDTDVGRPVDELTTALRYQDLTRDAREVLETLEPKEMEVQTEGGHWYQLRILPYRSAANSVFGLVCIFQDFQATKRLQADGDLLQGLLQTVHEPLLVLDPELRVVAANDGFYRVFPLTPAEVEERNLFGLGAGQWDQPELRALLQEALPERGSFRDFHLAVAFEDGTRCAISLSARQLPGEGGESGPILLSMEPVAAGGGTDGGVGG